jgi:hypothetical protein
MHYACCWQVDFVMELFPLLLWNCVICLLISMLLHYVGCHGVRRGAATNSLSKFHLGAGIEPSAMDDCVWSTEFARMCILKVRGLLNVAGSGEGREAWESRGGGP